MRIAKKIFQNTYLVWVMILFVIIFALLSPNFLTVNNLTNILVQNSYMIVAALGIGIIQISGGADLSVSYQIGLTSIILARLMKDLNVNPFFTVVVGLLLGLLMGFLNGYLIVRLKVHPIIVTIATQQVFQGLAYIIAESRAFFDFPTGFTAISQRYVGPVPICVIIALVMSIIAYIIMNRTYFGRYIYAIGGNSEAARLAGINHKAIRILAFMLSGLFIAIASIVVTARTGSASVAIAKDAVFSCMTACVLGGVSFRGGGGQILNACVGVLIIGILGNGMQLIGLGIYYQYVVQGIILVAAIAFDTYQSTPKVKAVKEVKVKA